MSRWQCALETRTTCSDVSAEGTLLPASERKNILGNIEINKPGMRRLKRARPARNQKGRILLDESMAFHEK